MQEVSVSPGRLSSGGWTLDHVGSSPSRLSPRRNLTSPPSMQTSPVATQGSTAAYVSTAAPIVSMAPVVVSTENGTSSGIRFARMPPPCPAVSGIRQALSDPVFRVPVPGIRPSLAVTQPGILRASGASTRPRMSAIPQYERRRSQSNEGMSRAVPQEVARARLEDRVFKLSGWIRTRRDLIATWLISVEETMLQTTGTGRLSPQWIDEEVQFVLRTLEDTERSEMEVWTHVAHLRGPEARQLRYQDWSHWFQQMTAKVGAVRSRLARIAEVPLAAQVVEAGSCQRKGGFLERVRLPHFSGLVEDYGEFKCQFQELCRGESYTGIIELAQLRQKLPKEAVALLVGLATPESAWARLDETYGNQDLQVFAALKRLQSFKASKTAAQGQVVELAIAVQRCLTVLRALSREQDFLMDRETLAEVINTLPADSQQRWYHRRGARNETQQEKGTNFLLWLEEERADAVAIHLDTLARRQKNTVNPAPTQKVAPLGGGTDQPIYTATLTAQQELAALQETSPLDPKTALTQGGGGGIKSKPPGRTEVTTMAQAKEVAA